MDISFFEESLTKNSMVLLHATSENNAVAFPLLPNVDRKEQNFNADTTPTSTISNLAPLINLVDIALQSSQKVCRHFLFHNIMVATKEDFALATDKQIGQRRSQRTSTRSELSFGYQGLLNP
jgi:hypothetical protein